MFEGVGVFVKVTVKLFVGVIVEVTVLLGVIDGVTVFV